jgi:hypothetical protein
MGIRLYNLYRLIIFNPVKAMIPVKPLSFAAALYINYNRGKTSYSVVVRKISISFNFYWLSSIEDISLKSIKARKEKI